jgi:hypothetical protein
MIPPRLPRNRSGPHPARPRGRDQRPPRAVTGALGKKAGPEDDRTTEARSPDGKQILYSHAPLAPNAA